MYTNIHLLSVPFESNYKDTVYFPTKEAQASYMLSKRTAHSFSDCTYQRKDSSIRVPVHIDRLYNCNYVMYQNTVINGAGNDRWFYAFIVDMEYVSDEVTKITIETDVIQTWMFDYTVKQSFVEREHVSDDTIGLHTVPENLETGEYINVKRSFDIDLKNLCIVWGTTKTQTGANVVGANYHGIYSGIKYYYTPQYSPLALSTILENYAKEGWAEAIQCVFMAPEYLVMSGESTDVKNSNEPIVSELGSVDLTQPTTLNGYKPKNNKLFTFPYMYLMVSNNNGADSVYYYEKFSNNTPNFKKYSALTPGCSIRIVPENYNGVELNHEEGLNLGKFPICNWNSDVYTNWLTQNSVNIGLSVATGIGQIVAGGAIAIGTGGLGLAVGGSQIVGGVSTIANQLAQIHQHSFTPPQSQGNINCGDVVTANDSNNFWFNHMTIKKEYAQIIDDYFSMFGYKVNRVKVPNKNHRSRYWYTKTVDVNIDGAIPNKDLQTIKNCYNNGITFWRSDSTMGDYTSDNLPI